MSSRILHILDHSAPLRQWWARLPVLRQLGVIAGLHLVTPSERNWRGNVARYRDIYQRLAAPRR